MGKSSKHKSENTYRFQSFTERISAVNIDVIHKIRHYDDTQGEQETYFGEALTLWSELNCTEHFKLFQQEISGQVNTFTQLVHHEDEIVAALKKHLQVARTLAYEPLLDLLVQLARDLQTDFYRHFEDFFVILVKLLNANSHDTDILEKMFSSLAYIFKFLWRYLVKDIQSVFGYFSSLLGGQYKDYIQKFAAESFAFLMRKVKDHHDLFDFLFSCLEQDSDKAHGIGQLLFEMMKGVKHQFHSITDKVLPLLLYKTGPWNPEGRKCKLPWSQVEGALRHFMGSCADYTSKEHAAQLWSVLLNCTTSVLSSCKKCTKKQQKEWEDQVCRLLRLMCVWLEHHHGAIITDPKQVANTLIQIVKEAPNPEHIGESLLDAISLVLIMSHDHLPMDVTVRLVSQVYQKGYKVTDLAEFTKKLFDLPIFEKDILPNLLGWLHCVPLDDTASDVCLGLVTRLLLHKVKQPNDGSDLQQIRSYNLDFSTVLRSRKQAGRFQKLILSLLTTECEDIRQEPGYLSQMWAALVCVPHISPVVKSDVMDGIKKAWSTLKSLLSSSEEKQNVLFVMEQAVVSLLSLTDDSLLYLCLPWNDIKQLLQQFPSNYHVLKMADLYLSQALIDEVSDMLLEHCLLDIFGFLEKNLASWSHPVRLLSLHILSLFPVKLPQVEDVTSDRLSVFEICLAAERCPLSVYNYRDRLMHLQKLDHGLVQSCIPAGPFSKVPLLYLIGSVFLNFKLLWDPLRVLISSHAQGLEKSAFWEVYCEHLVNGASMAEKSYEGSRLQTVSDSNKSVCSDSNHTCVSGLFNQQTAGSVDTDSRPDFTNFRLQLWKSMHLFSDKCEPKSREISPLFIRFLSNEYFPSDLSVAPTQNISDRGLDESQEVEEDVDGDQSEEDVTSHPVKSGDRTTKRKGVTKSLLVHLELFSKFKNPKSLYLEPELNKYYFEFVQHKNNDVQKMAFQCLMTYKPAYLVPYRENFLRILDDKTFKEEIVLFSIDEESSIIKTEHRNELLTVLMGILFGRMQSKAGKDTTGRAKSSVRQSIVFRFLAGCSMDELHTFLDLVFKPCQQLITADPCTMIDDIKNTLNLQEVMPLRRMKGILNTMAVITNKLGHMIESYLPSLLRIIVGLASTCALCLEKREEVKSSAVISLKIVRRLASARIISFFDEFDNYPFSSEEIDAVFQAFVWPQLSKLPFEGVYSPTPLMKLFEVWSKNSKFQPLLAMCDPANPELSPLSSVLVLLNSKDTSHSVTEFILTLVENLLHEDDAVENSAPSPWTDKLPSKVLKDLDFSQSDNDRKSVGACLVLPHVPVILTYLKKAVSSLKSKAKDQKQGSYTGLKILAKVSQFATDDEQCSTLCSLLFPFLDVKIKKGQKVEENILQSILNLVSSVLKPEQFYRPVAKLFSVITVRQSRILVCDIFKTIGRRVEKYEQVADWVEKLNAWDKRRTEEPDYTVRLETFRAINQFMGQMEALDIEFFLPIMHNCCHFILTVDDLSLRDNSTYSLTTILSQFTRLGYDQNVFRELVSQGLLVQVKSGLHSKNESVRHEFFTLLGTLVKTFADNSTFEGLIVLRDVDPDTDFFENIRHIQVHRRARALRKLMMLLEHHSFRREMIMSYFWPIATTFILDPIYAKLSVLHDAAVPLIGVLCRLLPWQLYSSHLKFFLGLLPKRLESQKLLVRVIVSILDAFHFDLTQSGHHMSKAPAAVQDKMAEDPEVTPDEIPADTSTMDAAVKADEDETDSKDEGGNTTQKSLTAGGKQLCSSNLATKIHVQILHVIIPQLHKVLTQKARSDSEHKSVRSKYVEDEEILRVPLALAMVKLLQNLPHGSLERNLPGILLKVCHFLKSRARDIRQTARDTLLKMSLTLGPRYLPYILSEMKGILKRGYQVHVLGYTVHFLLKHMSPIIEAGDLDAALHNLLEIFTEELFGTASEEKDVQEIAAKTFEARTTKSYDSYQIVAQYIGHGCLMRLIAPVKDILESTHSHKVAQKVQDILRKISHGLMENKSIPIETLMLFIHTLTFDTVHTLQDQTKEKPRKKALDPRIQPPSCLLLQPALPRGGDKPKTAKKTNIHVIVEFGLQLLYLCLKRSSLVASDNQHLQLLDPLIGPLADCLESKHIKINTYSMRCLLWLLKFPLPSLKIHIEKIVNGLFVLLKNYATAGAAKGDNLELVFTCFKCVTVLLREVKFYKIDTSKLHVLLTFCEEDLYDYTRQSSAFVLLKAILSRKLDVPELHSLMDKVEKEAIVADNAHMRLQCRQIIQQYLLDYLLGRKLIKHLEYFVAQLSYSVESGRESTLEMMATMFSTFPEKLLIKHAGMFFVPMAVALVNDNSTRCRKLTALAIKLLLEKIDAGTRDGLFNITLEWFKDNKVQHRTLAAQLCGLFVEVEAAGFNHRLDNVLPLVEQQINPSRYHDLQTQQPESDQSADHFLYNTLNTLAKILQHCDVIAKPQWTEQLNTIWEHIYAHLQYAHAWVRLVSAQLFGLLFASWTPEDLCQTENQSSDKLSQYLQIDLTEKVKQLIYAFVSQLQSPILDQDLADQVVKNMLFLGSVVILLSQHDVDVKPSDDAETSPQQPLSVRWITRKMVREANHEAVISPRKTIKRSSVFKWLAAYSLKLDSECLTDILHIILPPLQREITRLTEDSCLKTLAQEVINLLKKTVGVEDFTKVFISVQQSRSARKETRKRHRAIEAVSNPEIAARKRLKKNLQKKEAKKRKIDRKNPSKKIKRKRLLDMAIVQDD
ncbi:small subunit processome component 20 homolog [Gigantopelta aegis]|uniref:small subunit processome component 20 homolog n=1 Tax=Gigantopelta aegis TaxID=1735272 RepID=UPI001B88AFE7|nr:small subunit processome component 20 homolog [Gigantopelta aegis]